MVNIALGGADASLYEYSDVFTAFQGFLIIPELGFSPIPAIYTDGMAEDLSVWLVNGTSPFSQPDVQPVRRLHRVRS
jgi:hypothetical protein